MLCARLAFDNVVDAMDEAGGDWMLRLTKQTLDGNGNVISEVYSRQNSTDTPTEGMRLKRLSKAPNGGEWRIYEQSGDMAIAYSELVQELSLQARPFPPTDIPDGLQQGYCLMPMLTDHHFGKIAFGYKGDSWSLDEAREVWQRALDYYLYKAQDLPIAQVLLPIGNDLLHTNSDTNTTKRGHTDGGIRELWQSVQICAGCSGGGYFVLCRDCACSGDNGAWQSR